MPECHALFFNLACEFVLLQFEVAKIFFFMNRLKTISTENEKWNEKKGPGFRW